MSLVHLLTAIGACTVLWAFIYFVLVIYDDVQFRRRRRPKP